MGETSKAYQRRVREGWFEKYAPEGQIGLDIGCQHDPLNLTFRRWDTMFGDSDGTILAGVKPNTFHTVYASHVLEHIPYPAKAIARWYEVLAPFGHLIIVVPHRDLYERRKMLPSQWNFDHKYFYLPETEEPPCTKSLKHLVLDAIPDANIVEFKVLDEGYDHNLPQGKHPCGEYSIEIIVRKDY